MVDTLSPRPASRAAPWLLSVLAHLLFFALLLATSRVFPRRPLVSTRPVSLRGLNARQWALNRGDKAPPPPPLEAPPQPPRPIDPIGQVVDVGHGNDVEPTHARFLAETNNRVAHEQRDAHPNTFGRAGPGKPRDGAQPERPKRGTALHAAPTSPVAQATQERWDLLGAANGYRPKLSSLLQANTQAGPEVRPGTGSEAGSEGVVDSTSAAPAAEEGGGVSHDALDGLDEGNGTFLNTRQWVYAGFFNRVKEAIGAHWDPNAPLRARNINESRDRVTVVMVVLDEQGALKDAAVVKSSGLDVLDAEAVHAIERAAPFPNPPKGLVQKDGLIRFPFGFQLIWQTGQVNLFRYR